MKKIKIISAGIVPVYLDADDNYKVLLLRSHDYWDFPKGKVEPGESIIDAAKRETLEEAGLNQEELNFAWKLDHCETEVYGNGKMAIYFIAAVSDLNKVAIKPNAETGVVEHNEYRWFSFEEARKVAGPRISKIIDWAEKRTNIIV